MLITLLIILGIMICEILLYYLPIDATFIVTFDGENKIPIRFSYLSWIGVFILIYVLLFPDKFI